MPRPIPSATLAFVFFVLLTTALFAEFVLGDATFAGADALHSQALVAPLRGSLAGGEPPLWASQLFAGMPTAGSLLFTPGVYLPELLVDWTGLRWTTFMVLHLAVAGLGAFCAARGLGAGPLPALVAGLSFAHAPYMVALADVGHGSQLITASWLPFVFWAVQRLLERRDLASLAVCGLVLGLLLQGRHVQIAYYGVALAVALWLAAVPSTLRHGGMRAGLRASAGFAAALGIAALLAARLYLPLLEYGPWSIRGAPSVLAPASAHGVGVDYATQWSLPPAEALTYVLPALFGLAGPTYSGELPFTDFPNYVGLLPLVWALTAIAMRVPGTGFLAALGAIALLLSFGRHLWPVYAAAYRALPFFDAFRVPAMALVLLNLAIALLAALGLERASQLAARPALRRRVGRSAFVAAAGVALVGALAALRSDLVATWLGSAHPQMLQLDLVVAALLLAAGLIGLGLVARSSFGPSLLAGLTVGLSVVDLWRVDRVLLHPTPPELVHAHLGEDRVTRFLLDDPQRFRILPLGDLFRQTRWVAHGIESAGGYHAAKPRAYQDLLEASGLQTRPPGRLLDLLNVKYVLSLEPLDLPQLELRQSLPSGSRWISVYENREVLPRPFLVGAYEVVPEPRRALERLLSPDFDPRLAVILEQPPAFEPLPDAGATVEVEEAGSDRLLVRTHSAAPQILVLSDNHYPPGWSARIDGEPSPILRADFAFRALSLPAGSHEVEWLARSPGLCVGRRLTQAGTLLVAVLLAVSLALRFARLRRLR